MELNNDVVAIKDKQKSESASRFSGYRNKGIILEKALSQRDMAALYL